MRRFLGKNPLGYFCWEMPRMNMSISWERKCLLTSFALHKVKLAYIGSKWELRKLYTCKQIFALCHVSMDLSLSHTHSLQFNATGLTKLFSSSPSKHPNNHKVRTIRTQLVSSTLPKCHKKTITISRSLVLLCTNLSRDLDPIFISCMLEMHFKLQWTYWCGVVLVLLSISSSCVLVFVMSLSHEKQCVATKQNGLFHHSPRQSSVLENSFWLHISLLAACGENT